MTYDRAAVIAAGTGAAARMRKQLRANGYTACARCGFSYLASALHVDHILALVNGGEDTDDNVQPLCRRCHEIKTIDDMGYNTTPF